MSWFVAKPLTLSLLFGFFFLFAFHWQARNRLEYFTSQSLLLLATFFIFSPYAPQFLIWFYPLLIIDAVNNPQKSLILGGVTIAILGIFFFWGGTDALSFKLHAESLMTQIINIKRAIAPARFNQLFETMSALFTGALIAYVLYTLKANFFPVDSPKTKR